MADPTQVSQPLPATSPVPVLTPEEQALKDLQDKGLSPAAKKVTDYYATPPTPPAPPPTPMGMPSGSNPLWNLAAKQEGLNPYTGQPMLDPMTGQPMPPWHFQQGPMQLPPVPTPGQPLP